MIEHAVLYADKKASGMFYRVPGFLSVYFNTLTYFPMQLLKSDKLVRIQIQHYSCEPGEKALAMCAVTMHFVWTGDGTGGGVEASCLFSA